MYVTEHSTDKALTISVDIGRISHDAANAAELEALLLMVQNLCIEAAVLDAALCRMIAPF